MKFQKIRPMPIIPADGWVATWNNEVRWVNSDGNIWAWKVKSSDKRVSTC